MAFTTKHIMSFFNVSHQTVKNWSDEFDTYLSPTARPEPGRPRHFTEADMQVFALVSEMKQAGATFESIHMALRMGQRGDIPTAPDAIQVAGEGGALLALRQRNAQLEARIRDLETSDARKEGQITLLKEQLAEAQKDIRRLERENARLSGHDD